MSVFVIINEWTANNNGSGAEVVGGRYFDSEDSAWEALRLIAEEYNTDLPVDEFSLSFEDHSDHLQFEEFYVEELTKGE